MKVGVFDSGLGGLTIFQAMLQHAPAYDYLYLGDNARAPYGGRSFETILRFTREAVEALFARDCLIVVLACNTASAKALRNLQQQFLPAAHPGRRILGVIRPSVEQLHAYSHSGSVAIWATPGTVRSDSYRLELEKLAPGFRITQQACPLLVPMIENGELENAALDYFVRKYWDETIVRDPAIDVLLLACTHYPLVQKTIRRIVPPGVRILTQDAFVGPSWADYLARHPELETQVSRSQTRTFFTTDREENFAFLARTFLGYPITAQPISL